MAFDIKQDLFGKGGEIKEEKTDVYRQELTGLFEQSPEAKTFLEEDADNHLYWADTLVEFGLRYLNVAPPQMTPNELREILFEIFPSKVSTIDFDAVQAIHELRAFWNFLKREFNLENADVCLRVLDDEAAHKFEHEMNNPDNFGIAKSMFMMGKARGFDMTTEEGINQWMQTYNAEIMAGTGTPIPLPGESGPEAAKARGQMKQALRKDKRKRQMAKQSRKQNRKKKK
jgi:hypothetical protein